MDESNLWQALVFILGTGAIGVYLLLPADHPFTASAVKWFGAPLAIISLILLASLVGVPVEWWPKLPEGLHVSRVLFAIPAFASVAAAALAVTSRDTQRCVFWFGGLLLSNSVLFLLHGAYLLAVSTVTLLGAAAAAGWFLGVLPLARSTRREVADPTKSHEPFLACLTGSLLAAVLIGTVATATGGIGVSDVERLAGLMTRKRQAVLETRNQADDPDWINSAQPHFRSLARAIVRDHGVATSAVAFVVVLSLVAVPLIRRRPKLECEDSSGFIDGDTRDGSPREA
ncbi:MAG: hypothetical protein WD648_09850 [Planctomycetaceae bacterium]